MSDTELASNVGKYVDYTPVSGSFSDHTNPDYSGYLANLQMSTVATLKWRILDVNGNKLILISDTVANTGLALNSATGYNNGVLLLNNACKAMYSNEEWATGRSLNIDDIEKYMTYDKTSSPMYGDEYLPTYTTYPSIFAKELNGAPNGTYGTELDLSEQNEYITGGTLVGNSQFKGKWTRYSFEMSTSTMKNQIYVDLLSSATYTWLASRCVSLSLQTAEFCIFYIWNNNIGTEKLFESDQHNGDDNSYAIRPIVEIDLTKVNVGLTGDGSSSTPYSITAK